MVKYLKKRCALTISRPLKSGISFGVKINDPRPKERGIESSKIIPP
jgi:hypothetical protein